MSPSGAIGGILTSLELLLTDSAIFVVASLGLLVLFILTMLPATILLDLACFSKLEYLLDTYLVKGKIGTFLKSLIFFDNIPKQSSIVPKTVRGAIFSVGVIYFLSLLFTVYFGEVLFYTVSGYASQISFEQDAALFTPIFAMLLVYVTRIMVFFKYPRSADLTLFLPFAAFWFLAVGLYAFVYRFHTFTSYWLTIAQNGSLPFVLRNVLYFSIFPIIIEVGIWALYLKRKNGI